MTITAFYAALLALIYVILSFRVIQARIGARVAIGDGGDKGLLRRMRVHANFAEYAPFALLLIGLAESLRINGVFLHVLGAALLFGRVSHAWGVSREKETLLFRQAGMAATFAVIIAAAAACLYGSLARGLFS